MRRILPALLLLCIMISAAALEYPGSAVSDDALSLRINPAAMAFGNASGFTYIQPYLIDEEQGVEPELLDDFSLQLASSNLGYYFDKYDQNYRHNLLFAAEAFPNFYFGFKSSWENGSIGDSRGDLGLLARPSDYLSLGATLEDMLTSDLNGRLGIGLRPLAGSALRPTILTLGADLPWSEGFDSPKLYGSSEAIPGFEFSLAYDMEAEELSLGFSYSVGVGRAGTLIDEDTNGAAYLHLGTREYTRPAPPLSSTYIDFAPGPVILEEPNLAFPIFAPRQPSLLEVIRELEELERDPSVKGIVIDRHNFVLSWAGYLELIEALNSFRAAGKRVIYYFEDVNQWNYILAAATGDAVYLQRLGSVDLRGLGSTRLYFGGLFEKFGITIHNIRSHPYKSGANTFSETGITPEEREMLSALYEDVYRQSLELISGGRGEKLNGSIEELAAAGPYLDSDDALAAGLVDGLIYRDELEEKLTEFDRNPVIRPTEFLQPFRRDWSDPYYTQIALIYAVGDILPGEGLPGSRIGSESISASIREARENPFVKALVLRIDSGGGSSLASDVIAREVKLTVEAGKPVIVSMGGTAASGGYYIAAYADKIVASPMSITGSIGVYAAFPELSSLLEEYQVGTASVETEDNADFLSPFKRLEATEQERIQATIDRIYEIFLEVVAEGRNMSRDEVDEAAQGRVWTGSQALDLGLVDQLGGLRDAVAVAVEEADLRGEYMLVDYSDRDMPLSLRMAETLNAGVEHKLPRSLQELSEHAALISLAEKEHFLYLLPFTVGNERGE